VRNQHVFQFALQRSSFAQGFGGIRRAHPFPDCLLLYLSILFWQAAKWNMAAEFIDADTEFLRIINGQLWALSVAIERKILLKAKRKVLLESPKTWDFVLLQFLPIVHFR